jgi:iron complex outermembrane receptor protein
MNFANLAARGGRLSVALAAFLMLVMTPWTPVRAESGGAQGAIEEMIVTARKREESVLEIPETVSVLSGDAIARRDLTTLDDIGNSIANLNLSKRADGFPNVSIRGVGNFGNTQSVGFYLDDSQIFSDASSRFGDLERIEVLKGPQGVLYGGSNIGGAVKFVSRRPDSEEVSGRVKVRAGEQSIIDLEGSINVPLGDNGWAMRMFGFFNEDDGFLVNPNNARVNGLRSNPDKDEGQIEEFGGRFSIAGPLGERLSVFAAARYNEFDGPNNYWIRELDDDLDYSNEVANSLNSSHKRETFAGTLELTLELDSMDLVSLTSYTDTESDRYTDIDIREEYLLDFFRPERMDVFTQEIRLASTHDGPLQWLVGGYYSLFEEKMRSFNIWYDAGLNPDGTIGGPLGCFLEEFDSAFACSGVWAGETVTLEEELTTLETSSENRNRDKSHLGGFASATYSWEAWELNVGFRVDRWKNESENFDSAAKAKTDDVEFLPRVSLSRFLNDDHMLYFTFAEGFEPGGFNSGNLGTGLREGFEPERASSFELGWKGKSADGRFTATLAAFFIDYEARQVEFQALIDGGLVEGITNGGDSENFGIEAEAMWRVNDWLSLSAAFGWVDAEWDSGTLVDGPEGPVDVGGTTPPVIQDVNWHLGADFQYPIGSGGIDFIASVQVNHSGEFNGLQVWDTPPVKNPDYTIVNAQVGLAGERWELTVNAKNLFDEDHHVDLQSFPNVYVLDIGPGGASEDGNINIGTLGQPRLITGSLTYRF